MIYIVFLSLCLLLLPSSLPLIGIRRLYIPLLSTFISSILISSVDLYLIFSSAKIDFEGYKLIHFNGSYLSFHIDYISAIYSLTVVIISLIISLYSLWYMKDDSRIDIFFSYLNIFVFSMLLLLISKSMILLFTGWELVGLSSYLLIGFWHKKEKASTAANKAFYYNRFGDIALLSGIIILYHKVHTLDIEQIINSVSNHTSIDIVAVLFLIAISAKSVQLPMHGWILDAMEGPTPVSALIHSATMVTAGIYLLIRFNIFYQLSYIANNILIIISSLSIIVGATIALFIRDTKKILAGSTMSQIGYMALSTSMGYYGSILALMHFLIHAFFKSSLFLSIGSTMHINKNSTSIYSMNSKNRYVELLFILSSLSLIGIPLFGSFWSKELIIGTLFDRSNMIGIIPMLASFITTLYIIRLYYYSFRYKKDIRRIKINKIPVGTNMILALISLLIGFISYFLIIKGERFYSIKHIKPNYFTLESILLSSLLIVVIIFTLFFYNKRDIIVNKITFISSLFINGLYIDYSIIKLSSLSLLSIRFLLKIFTINISILNRYIDYNITLVISIFDRILTGNIHARLAYTLVFTIGILFLMYLFYIVHLVI